jgi:hypothetical protein
MTPTETVIIPRDRLHVSGGYMFGSEVESMTVGYMIRACEKTCVV